MPKRLIEKIWLFFESLNDSLISKSISANLRSHYGGDTGHNFDLGRQDDLGYGLLHYSLISNFKPKRVLCIGSGKGFIPAICALACKDNKLGKVDFVDAGYSQKNTNSWGGTGFWKSKDSLNHFNVLKLTDWISVHVMTSKDFHSMGTKRKWQYIYIDADHSYKGVKRDYDLYWPNLEVGGLMLFHDILIKSGTQKLNYGVNKFWKKLGEKNKITVPFSIQWGIPSGLGILQKT